MAHKCGGETATFLVNDKGRVKSSNSSKKIFYNIRVTFSHTYNNFKEKNEFKNCIRTIYLQITNIFCSCQLDMKGHILVKYCKFLAKKTHQAGRRKPRTIKSAQFSAVIADILHPWLTDINFPWGDFLMKMSSYGPLLGDLQGVFQWRQLEHIVLK